MGDVTALRGFMDSGALAEAWEMYEGDKGRRDPEWHLVGALTAWKRQQPILGKRAAQTGLKIRPKGELLVKLHFINGVCHRECGDTSALQEFDAVLDLLPKHPELMPLLKGPTLYNKGLFFWQFGRAPEAVPVYEAALDEFGRESFPEYRRKALENLAWTCASLGQHVVAFRYLDEAADLVNSDEARHIHEATRAYCCYVSGQTQEAARLVERWGKDETVSHVTRSLLASIGALVLLRLGDIANAEVAAYHARDLVDGVRGWDHRALRFAIGVQQEINQEKIIRGVS